MANNPWLVVALVVEMLSANISEAKIGTGFYVAA